MVSTLREEIGKCGGFRSQIQVEFFLALVISIAVSVIIWYGGAIPPSGLYTGVFTSSAAMLGLMIAAYSLVLNIGTDEFKSIFHRHESFRQLRVSFSITAIVLGVAMAIAMTLTATSTMIPEDMYPEVVFVTMFPCLWGAFNIIVLVSNALRQIGEILSEDS